MKNKTFGNTLVSNMGLVLITVIVMNGCSSTESDIIRTDELTTINISNISNQGKNDLPIDNWKIIPLQAKKSSLIGSISKVIYRNGKFYILDREIVKAIFVFDKDGDFLYRIRRRGRGPGEYAECFDIDVDQHGNLYVLDINNRKIIKYSEKGKFLDEYLYGFMSFQFGLVAKDTFALYQLNGINEIEETKFNLMYFTSDQQLTKRYLPYQVTPQDRYTMRPYNFFKSTESTLFNKTFSDTVYSVESSGVNAKYALNFMENKLPKEELAALSGDEAEKLLYDNDIAWKYSNFYENERVFTSTFRLNKKLGFINYKKEDSSVDVYYLDDIGWDNIVTLLPMGMLNENKFFGYLSRSKIKILNKEKGASKLPVLKDLNEAIAMEEMDSTQLTNPVIVTYELL